MEDFNFDQIFEKMSSLTVEMAKENTKPAVIDKSTEAVTKNKQNTVNTSNEKTWVEIFIDFIKIIFIVTIAIFLYKAGKSYENYNWKKSQVLDSGKTYEEEYVFRNGKVITKYTYVGGNLIDINNYD